LHDQTSRPFRQGKTPSDPSLNNPLGGKTDHKNRYFRPLKKYPKNFKKEVKRVGDFLIFPVALP
jgi:hypothetical protein